MKRAAVVAEVDRLHVEGLLSWESAPELVLPFPEHGASDEHREGQEDEGEEPDCKAWRDRGDPSTDECESASEMLVVSCAGGGKHSRALAETVEAGNVAERIRQVQDMIVQARDLGNPRVVMTLERACRTLQRPFKG